MAARPKAQREAQESDLTDNHPRPPRESPLDAPPNFAEQDYRIAASDSKGRVERVWVRLPPYLVRLVQTLVVRGPYPWETPSDAYRFAIYWGLRLLKHNPPDTITTFAQIQGMNDILSREEDLITFRAVFDRAQNVLNEYQREGAAGLDEARRVIGELDARINQMPEGYWRAKYARLLRERFGPMMRGERMALASSTEKLRVVSGRAGVDVHEPEEDGDGHLTGEGE